MHGHHGFGGGWGHGGGWGRHGGFGGGWGRGFGGGFGLGWIFPALLVGRVIQEAFDRPPEPAAPIPWPPHQSAWPQQPAGPLEATQPHPALTATNITCQGCGRQVASSHTFCPNCGTRLTPAACRYCGQMLKTGEAMCAHCGGPRR